MTETMEYVIRLRPQPRTDDGAGIRGLRRLLKRLLRGYGRRCVEVRRVDGKRKVTA